MLVLGILMAIAIPLIGGVREAANNTKCRSNLKQLHTAIIAYATGNKERLPNLVGSANLQSLINGGYIDADTKLGDCPGSPAKERGLSNSAYQGGSDLDGTKTLSSKGVNSETIVLEDADSSYHKAGKNAIRLDGSFTQSRGIRKPVLTEKQQKEKDSELLNIAGAPFTEEDEVIKEIRRLLEEGANIDAVDENFSNFTAFCYAILGGRFEIAKFLIDEGIDINIQNAYDETALHNTLESWDYNDESETYRDKLNEIAKLLIDKEPDWTVRDANDKTPLAYAESINNTEIVEYIREAMEN